MNLQEYKFPTLTMGDIAFSTVKTDPILLAEAKARGFYNGDTKYNKMFSACFFKGGEMILKKKLPKEFAESAITYLKAFMHSWEPKHEEKEAICALLMSELLKDFKPNKK